MLEIVSKKSSTAKKTVSIDAPTSSRSLSWVARHEPSSLNEVPIHNTKVKNTKDWLKKALIANNEGGQVHVLAMCGNSGCCKSTALELICKEMQVEIVVWNEAMMDSTSFVGSQGWSREFTSNVNENGRDLFRLSETSSRFGSRKEDVLDDFALHSKYPTLGVITKKVSSAETNSKHQRIEMILERSRSLHSSSSSENRNRIVLIHDPPQLSPFGNSSSSGSRHKSSSTSVSEAESLYSFILHMGCPVVLIVSDVSGRDEYHYAAERCLPTSIRDSVCFESIYFPPITDLKIVKILEKIAKSEGLLSRVSRSQLEALAVSSGGDLRHCILQLQLLVEAGSRSLTPASIHASSKAAVAAAAPVVAPEDGVIDLTLDSDSEPVAAASVSPPAKKRRKQESDHIQHLMVDHNSSGGVEALSDYSRRDLAFSGMHSAAKLLSAKLDDNGRLDFQPDEVMDRSELSLDLMLAFLQGNCIDNFMEKCRCLYSVKTSVNGSSIAALGLTSPGGIGGEEGDEVMYEEEQPPDMMEQYDEEGNIVMAGTVDTAAASTGAAVTEASVDMTCLEQLENALSFYSDVDLLLTRKYEPGSSNVDRESGIFPDAYVAAIQARAAAVSRGPGFGTVYEEARSSGRYKAAFLGLKRPKILSMRTSVMSMRQRLSEIREAVVGLHHLSSTDDNVDNSTVGGGGELQSTTLHSLNLNSDLILCTVPLYRAIKAAQRERNPYQSHRPIFSEWIDWKIDTLQQQQHASSSRIVMKESSADSGGHMQALEIDFSKGASIEDDIVDDD